MSSTDDTNPGPAPDSDQLPLEDTLEQRGAEDQLDEGYSPPERPHRPRWGETAYEEAVGEPMDDQLAEEVPDEQAAHDPARQAVRDGRMEEGEETDEAKGRSVAGGAVTAEEAAVHLLDEDGQPPEDAITPEETLPPPDQESDEPR